MTNDRFILLFEARGPTISHSSYVFKTYQNGIDLSFEAMCRRAHVCVYVVQAPVKSPMDLIGEVAPIGVSDAVAKCYGSDDPSLGHPVEYICINDTTPNLPAVCKYCGLRYCA